MRNIFEVLYEILAHADPDLLSTLTDAIADYRETYPISMRNLEKLPFARNFFDVVQSAQEVGRA